MDGPMSVATGRDELKQKHDWWESSYEMHGGDTEGPYVFGDQFAVKFTLDATEKSSGKRMHMSEIGLYTVKDGKIVEERFFFNPADFQG